MNAPRLATGAALLLLCAPQAMTGAASAAQSDLTAFAGTWRLVPTAGQRAAETPPRAAAAGLPPMIAAALPRFRSEAAARIKANLQPLAIKHGSTSPLTSRYCKPMSFTGPTGYVVAPGTAPSIGFEILPSPGRLTLLDETGLVRRIYLRDELPVNALEQSPGGNSLAHLEGRTLVVRTTDLNPDAQVIYGVTGTELGHGASIVERYTPLNAEQMEIVATVTAPELYVAPVTTTNRYQRDPDRDLIVMNTCEENDRSFDISTGKERFDTSPPADLPPPPSD